MTTKAPTEPGEYTVRGVGGDADLGTWKVKVYWHTWTPKPKAKSAKSCMLSAGLEALGFRIVDVTQPVTELWVDDNDLSGEYPLDVYCANLNLEWL